MDVATLSETEAASIGVNLPRLRTLLFVSASVLAEIESNYQPDIVLIDTPPLMANDDSHGLLEMVDCALLVVAAERTPMERVDVAERQLSELTNVMGIVLNRCRYTRGAHGYENDYY